VEKQRWEESEKRREEKRRREKSEKRREEKRRREKIREEKELEEIRCRCAKRYISRDSLSFSNDLWLRRVKM